jgi:AraC-like DNA-binding protein
MQQLAMLCGRSLSAFRRNFNSIYNMSPSLWIRDKRLHKAKEILKNTRMPTTDICYILGLKA